MFNMIAALLTPTLLVVAAGGVLAATPYPTRQTPAGVDRGRLEDLGFTDPVTVTVALNLRDAAGAELMLQRVGTKGDPLYHHWLTPAQFAAAFGPTDGAVAQVRSTLGGFNLRTARATTTLLHVTGAPADLERAFGVSLHRFTVPATATAEAYGFRAPVGSPTAPAAIAPLVRGVVGLDARPAFRPHLRRTALNALPGRFIPAAGAPKTPNPPGAWTVRDFDIYYDDVALRNAGVTGAGRTLGIITLAGFTQSDAYTYWTSAGLTVGPGRITEIPVDGGAGPPSDAAGSDETTLDVEQSGGIAPGAAILVYEAPNTDQGFVDAFGRTVEDNAADSFSTSWGDWEWYSTLARGGAVIDPGAGGVTDQLKAVHDLLVQAGLQGQSAFAAAGDAGAYDINGDVPPPTYSLTLSVDYPGSDPAITSAGGTTLAGTQVFAVPDGEVSVTIPTERVWSWDYLTPLCTDLGMDPVTCGIFPVGGGGGVSIEFPAPTYQLGVTGLQRSAIKQVLVNNGVSPPHTIYALPARYNGRNVPDVSFNADPDTGYVVGYTSSAPGGAYASLLGYGGTSFVAPQLNGVTQLLIGVAGHRLGLLNPLLYAAKFSASGKHEPINPITEGNNDFYKGRESYSPAAGLGTVNIANLAAVVK